MVYNWLEKLRPVLFPTRCRLCLAPGQPHLELCPACQQELPWLTHCCSRCALPLPAETSTTLCSNCQKRPLQLDSCEALFSYQPPVDRWIQRLKFHQDLNMARLLGELLALKRGQASSESRQIVIPVPLHRQRLAQRGYNQALEIIRPLRRLGYRVETGICQRLTPTRAQSDLPARARKDNVRFAFSTSKHLDDQKIILVDDVMTTGATLNELAGILKHAGASRVDAHVVARTVS